MATTLARTPRTKARPTATSRSSSSPSGGPRRRAAKRPQIPTPRPHQVEALDAIDQELRLSHGVRLRYDQCLRALTVMASGTGKTLVGAFAAQRMWDSIELRARQGDFTPSYAPVLVLVPSLQLAAQTVREWEMVFPGKLQWRTVCSEATLSEYDDAFQGKGASSIDSRYFESGQFERSNSTTTTLRSDGKSPLRNAKAVNGWLQTVNSYQRRLVVSTYHSMKHVAAADAIWGLIIEDEAHHCAVRGGAPTRSRSRKPRPPKLTKQNRIYSPALDGTTLRGLRRLALTATPRPIMVGGHVDGKYQPNPQFGRLVYNLPFSEAYKRGLLTNYRIVIQVKTYEDLARYVERHYAGRNPKRTFDQIVAQIRADDQPVKIEVDGETLNMLPHDLLCHVAASMFMAQHNLSRAVVFHNTISGSRRWAERHTKVMSKIPMGSKAKPKRQGLQDASVVVKHINGNNSMHHREEVLDGLRNLINMWGSPIEASIVCNAQCISEGIDVPALDLVVLAEMRHSSEQLAQIIGRVMRKDPNGIKDTGYVLIPLLVDKEVLTDKDRFAKSPAMQYVRDIIDALSINDDMLAGGEQEDAWWAGYSSSMSEKSGTVGTVRGLGAHTPYWWIQGMLVQHSWEQEPEVDVSIQTKDRHARVDLLFTAMQKMAERDAKERQRPMDRRLRAVKVDVGAWTAAINNHIVDAEIQRQRWWYTRGQIEAVLSKETGIE